jgi:hypothetical protein
VNLLRGLLASAGILTTWIIVGLLFVGIGLAVRRLLGVRTLEADDWLAGFWLGFSAVLLLLQLWHLEWPIGPLTSLVVAALGIAGLRWVGSDIRSWLQVVNWHRHRWGVALLVLTGIWLANQAIVLPNNLYDTGMYHYPVVKWVATYPVVPGLGNLHNRLGYNNAHLLYAALLGIGPWSGRVYYVANGLLVAVLAVQVELSALRFCRREGRHPPGEVFDLVLLLPVVILTGADSVGTLSTDVVPAVLLFVAASRLFSLLTRPAGEPNRLGYQVIVITTLCTAAVACKLSGLGVAGSIWVLVLWCSWRLLSSTAAIRGRVLTTAAAIALAFGGIWTARGVILSGFPGFPSTVAPFPVSWRVPSEMGDADRALIRFRAHFYYDKFTNRPPDSPWFRQWARHLLNPNEWDAVLLPSGIAAAAGLVWLSVRRRSRASPGWLLIVPAGVGIAFWFLTAPQPRFGRFTFWILAAAAVGAVVDEWGKEPSPSRRAAVLAGALLLALWPLAAPERLRGDEDHPVVWRTLSIAPGTSVWLPPVQAESLGTRTTATGLTLYYPLRTNKCWDAPLPCTPYPSTNLRLRGDGLSSGFVTDGDWSQENWPIRGSRFLEQWRAMRAGGGS